MRCVLRPVDVSKCALTRTPLRELIILIAIPQAPSWIWGMDEWGRGMETAREEKGMEWKERKKGEGKGGAMEFRGFRDWV